MVRGLSGCPRAAVPTVAELLDRLHRPTLAERGQDQPPRRAQPSGRAGGGVVGVGVVEHLDAVVQRRAQVGGVLGADLAAHPEQLVGDLPAVSAITGNRGR
jgi:hypothetical protein